MEPSQFDEFTKAMATPTSRRKALKRLAVGAIGGLLTFGGLRSALAGEKKCPPGLTNCGGKCVDTKKDPNNCGVCGTVCASGLCANGVCCAPGSIVCSTSSGDKCCSFTCCGGVHEQVCVDTEHDVNNCGGCGNVCPAGDICVKGKCVVPSCPGGSCTSGFHNCGKNEFNNCFCFKDPSGAGQCGCDQFCFLLSACTSNADCPAGFFCAVDTFCPQNFCNPNAGVCTQNCTMTCSLGGGTGQTAAGRRK